MNFRTAISAEIALFLPKLAISVLSDLLPVFRFLGSNFCRNQNFVPFGCSLFLMQLNCHPAPFGMERTYSVNMVGQFDERPAYQERVALFTSSGSLPNSFIVASNKHLERNEAMIDGGFRLRFCRSHNDTDRCISRDDFPSRIDTQGGQCG